MDVRTKQLLKLWERQHSSSELRFAAALEKFFKDQAERIARGVSDSPHLEDRIPAKILRDAFSINDEHNRFMRVVSAWLLRLMYLGAAIENANVPQKGFSPRIKARYGAGPVEIETGDTRMEVPAQAMARIRMELMQVETQPYWQGIQAAREARVAQAIEDGIRDGLSQRDIIAAVRERLSDEAKDRAWVIARTETTGALNAGHHAMRQELIASGHVRSEEWIALLDGATRISHSLLDGKHIRAGEQFNVGGTLAPYPGWYGLPAAERANCRCTSVAGATFVEE